MQCINKTTKEISVTRGDILNIRLQSKNESGFKAGDVIRFKVFKRQECDEVEIQRDFTVEEDSLYTDISLTKEDTTIGELINKDVKYWYEIELNPETRPQTIVGYETDDKGKPMEKIFRLLPEGGLKE